MKTRILIVLTLAISLVSHFSYGESNLSGLNSNKTPIGKWEIKVAPEGMSEMPAVLEISQTDDKKAFSGIFNMMGNKVDAQDLKIEENRLSFKADMGSLVLSFDLSLKDDQLEGKVNASDGVKGTVSGKRLDE